MSDYLRRDQIERSDTEIGVLVLYECELTDNSHVYDVHLNGAAGLTVFSCVTLEAATSLQ